VIEQIEKNKNVFSNEQNFSFYVHGEPITFIRGKNRMQKENKSAEKGTERGGNIGIFLRSYH